jgi:hypothetical protein
MITALFNVWERRLASVDTDRVVRPFEWGLDWLGLEGAADPLAAISRWSAQAVDESHDSTARPRRATANSAVTRCGSRAPSPHPSRSTIPSSRTCSGPTNEDPRAARRAVVVLPQWNADAEGHAGLCRLFARFGLTAVKLTLPYHGERRPHDLTRADYIVSANVGRTLHANRQAVLDAKRVVDWLVAQDLNVSASSARASDRVWRC